MKKRNKTKSAKRRLEIFSHSSKKKESFSLLELLIVIAIVVSIAALATPQLIKLFTTKRISENKQKLNLVSCGVRDYYREKNQIPSQTEFLDYFSDLAKDSYGRDFLIFKSVTYNGEKIDFIIISKGLNGVLDSTVADGSDFIAAGDDEFILGSIKDLVDEKISFTKKRLFELRDRILLYYFENSKPIETIFDVATDNEAIDGFGSEILKFENVVYSVDNSAYDLVLISKSKNLILDSNVNDNSTFEPLNDDLYVLIQFEPIDEKKKRTLFRINQTNSAYDVCVEVTSDANYSGPSVDCTDIYDLIIYGYLEPKFAYDLYGKVLYYSSDDDRYHSSGPDQIIATADDL